MRSIALCGSKRFARELAALAAELKAAGILVFEPNFKEPLLENINLGSDNLKHTVFKGLTFEHFEWIRKADTCYIYNKDNYVGVSVTMEMAFAHALGKPVFALENETDDPARNALIDKTAPSAAKLLELLK